MSNQELKPCPFCGGEADVFMGLISCVQCPVHNLTREDWNKRADHIVDDNKKVSCSEIPNDWVSVDTRLPECNDDSSYRTVLVADKFGNMATAYHDAYGWEPDGVTSNYDMSDAGLTFKPTHWKPLGPPPKEGE